MMSESGGGTRDVNPALSLEFLRLGAAVLIQDMERYEKNFSLSGAPLFIGANGNGKGEGKGNSKKRRRGSVDKEWLAGLQPQLKRLARNEKPESIALKIARNMLHLPNELLQPTIEYLLRPIFPEQQGPVQTIVSRSGRMGVAMKEYQLRKTAYIFLLDLTNKNRELKVLATILSSNYTRRRLYTWWFRKPTAPLWVGEDRYPGPAFSELQVKKYAIALPVGAGEHEGWYNHFLANVMFHWHLSELAREVWSAGLQKRRPDEYTSWPGAPSLWYRYPIMTLAMSRTHRTTGLGLFGGALLQMGGNLAVEFAAGHNLQIPKIIDKVIDIIGLERGPMPQTQEQIDWHSYLHDDDDDTYPQGGPRPKSLFEQAAEKLRRQYVILMARVMFRVTVVRMPTILWDLKKYDARGGSRWQRMFGSVSHRQTRIEWSLPGHFGPYLLFDEPLRAYNPSSSDGPWVFDLVEQPSFDKGGWFYIQNMRFLSLTNAERGISRWIRANRLEKHNHIKLLHVMRPRNRRLRIYLPNRQDARDLIKDVKHKTSSTTGFEVDRQSGYEVQLLDVTTGRPIERPMSKSEITFLIKSPPAWLAIVRSPGDPWVFEDDDDDDDDDDNNDDDDEDNEDDPPTFWN